jgi:hypothetical protein
MVLNIRYNVQKSTPLNPVWRQLNPDHILRSYFFKIIFTSSQLSSPKFQVVSSFQGPKYCFVYVYIPPLFCASQVLE